MAVKLALSGSYKWRTDSEKTGPVHSFAIVSPILLFQNERRWKCENRWTGWAGLPVCNTFVLLLVKRTTNRLPGQGYSLSIMAVFSGTF